MLAQKPLILTACGLLNVTIEMFVKVSRKTIFKSFANIEKKFFNSILDLKYILYLSLRLGRPQLFLPEFVIFFLSFQVINTSVSYFLLLKTFDQKV